MKDYILFIAAMLIFGSNGVFASMLDMSGAQLVLCLLYTSRCV